MEARTKPASKLSLRVLDLAGPTYYGLLAIFATVAGIGLLAAWDMEHNGHWVTGMDNQIVWGIPHVFAIFLILGASGALNVASMSSVFGRSAYKPLAPFSALLAIAMLVGGLAVLVLDLGRPDRLLVAMTSYNFKSIFAWNIFLYTGLLVVAGVYIWTMLEYRMNRFAGAAGLVAFAWRLALTTGTGLIFGFLIAREAYDSAVLAPLFIALSFAIGLAVFILVLTALDASGVVPLGSDMTRRLGRLLGIFAATVLYFTTVQHLTGLYAAEHAAVERFILRDGGAITAIFWVGQVLAGGLLPLALMFLGEGAASRFRVGLAAGLVVIGAMALLYVTIIGGQAFPLSIFPGMEVSSSFFDGEIATYSPSLREGLLGLGGIAIAASIVLIGSRVLRFLPKTLADRP
jgi:Ni/Fe-hydrogenase subunit HybB-like protein